MQLTTLEAVLTQTQRDYSAFAAGKSFFSVAREVAIARSALDIMAGNLISVNGRISSMRDTIEAQPGGGTLDDTIKLITAQAAVEARASAVIDAATKLVALVRETTHLHTDTAAMAATIAAMPTMVEQAMTRAGVSGYVVQAVKGTLEEALDAEFRVMSDQAEAEKAANSESKTNGKLPKSLISNDMLRELFESVPTMPPVSVEEAPAEVCIAGL